MKITSLVKTLISTFFLLALLTSCEKDKPAFVKTDNTAEVKRLTTIGDSYFDNFDYKNAYPLYKKIIALADPVKDRVDYVDALIGLALIYQYQGDYIQSEEMIVQVLPHLKYFKKTRFAWYTYYIQGYNYFKTDNLERALFYYRKALHLKTKSFRKWRILNCIGIVYMKQEKYKAAAVIFEKVTRDGYASRDLTLDIANRNVLMTYCVELNNLGLCYYNLKNSKALDIYEKVLKIRLAAKDKENISTSYAALSEYYLKSNPQLAAKYAKLGYQKASEVNFFADKKYCLSFLAQSTTGNELKKYTTMYITFIDSVNTAQLKQKNEFSDIKYNFKIDKEENIELKTEKAEHELEIERQKNRSFISYIVLSISFCAVLFLIFYMTKKGRKEKNDAVFKNEIRISNKLHNELEKEIHEALSFAENKNLENTENKEQFLNQLNLIYSKTRSISRENSAILTDEHYADELKEMISKYASGNLNILVNGLNSFSWTKIGRVKKITVFRVLQEILDQMETLNNASLANITFKKEEKNILIMYVDNGTKISSQYTILQKRLQNVENRIKTIKGTLNFDEQSENSFKVSFKFPL